MKCIEKVGGLTQIYDDLYIVFTSLNVEQDHTSRGYINGTGGELSIVGMNCNYGTPFN